MIFYVLHSVIIIKVSLDDNDWQFEQNGLSNHKRCLIWTGSAPALENEYVCYTDISIWDVYAERSANALAKRRRDVAVVYVV